MTNILVECPQCIASVRVGVLAPLQYLQEKSLCQVRYRDTKDITREDIVWCDVLVCVRGCEYPTLRIVEAAKQAGRFLIYFLDDDLLHIPDGNASTKYYSDQKIKQYLIQILSLCHVLWAVNPRIIKSYSTWCQRTVLARVPAEPIRQPPSQAEEPLRVLFAGSIDHCSMVQQKLSPAISRLLSEFPHQVTFTFIGVDPRLPKQAGLSYYPYIDSYERYQRVVKEGDYALGLAPAYDTPFYACKYYNKFVEYSSFGIAGIYEAVPPFTDIVCDGENGFLCMGESEAWYQKIREIIFNRNKITEIAMTAQRHLIDDFSYETVSSTLVEQIPELVQFQVSTINADKVRPLPMKWLFYYERIQLLFRAYGITACLVILIKMCKRIIKMFQNKLENRYRV